MAAKARPKGKAKAKSKAGAPRGTGHQGAQPPTWRQGARLKKDDPLPCSIHEFSAASRGSALSETQNLIVKVTEVQEATPEDGCLGRGILLAGKEDDTDAMAGKKVSFHLCPRTVVSGSDACEIDAGWHVVKHRAITQDQILHTSHWARLLDTRLNPDRLKDLRKERRERKRLDQEEEASDFGVKGVWAPSMTDSEYAASHAVRDPTAAPVPVIDLTPKDPAGEDSWTHMNHNRPAPAVVLNQEMDEIMKSQDDFFVLHTARLWSIQDWMMVPDAVARRILSIENIPAALRELAQGRLGQKGGQVGAQAAIDPDAAVRAASLARGPDAEPTMKDVLMTLAESIRGAVKGKRSASKGPEEDSDYSEDERPSQGVREKLLRKHNRHPGLLTKEAVREIVQRMGTAWTLTQDQGLLADVKDKDITQMPPIFTGYASRSDAPYVKNIRSRREALTISFALDMFLKSKPEGACDILVQRLKALEMSSAEEGNWERANHLELIPMEAVGIASRTEVLGAAREQRADQRATRTPRAPSTLLAAAPKAKGFGKGKDSAPREPVKE